MPKPRGGVNAVEAHGCLHLFGGEFTTGVHPDHDVYNPVTNTWTGMVRMPTPVHGVTGAVFEAGLSCRRRNHPRRDHPAAARIRSIGPARFAANLRN